jgi:hypothetical protein
MFKYAFTAHSGMMTLQSHPGADMTEVTSNTPPTTIAETAPPTGDTTPPMQNYTDGYSYEVPRPFLSLHQAASVLGMTLRSLERSLRGRWGNKLPDGWLARKMKTDQGDEWRILPPPGFRVKLNTATTYDTVSDTELVENYEPGSSGHVAEQQGYAPQPPASNTGEFSNMQNPARRKQQQWRPERHTLDHPTIIIDRTEEVEHLLRELVNTKGALAEERRVHLEDMRMISQMQSSMRLLEVHAAEQAKVKTDLELAKQELAQWQKKYEEMAARPWWRRVFKTR